MILSQNIWNLRGIYKDGLEAAISVGIEKGQSAATLSKRISKYLNNFDSLRKDYKQKYGVATRIENCEYRAACLARTEINMAYRTAEQNRWRKLDFVLGYEVKLSNQHGHTYGQHGACEICEALAGKYPKTFVFEGWHPNCMCYAVPIMPSVAEMREYLDNDMPADAFRGEAVTQPPQSFAEFVTQNKENIQLQNPYWYRHNKDFTESVISNSAQANLMAIQSSDIVGYAELSAKEQNLLSSDIRDAARRCELFNKSFNIDYYPFDSGVLMEWRDNSLTISTARIKLEDGSIFCPAEKLQSAFAKLYKKQVLTFHEEYALECLFHENVHSKAIRKTKVVQGTVDEKIAETCTQLYARDRYVKILSKYGVSAKNFELIKYRGLGYRRECDALRRYFEKEGQLQVGELINIANETERGHNVMIKKIMSSGLSKTEAKRMLRELLQ
ncbi:MAG: hypothetical protein IKR17_10330 [Bacteroidales bacterium]|nr:hypothetical protein [Bacteroidales bacterium]